MILVKCCCDCHFTLKNETVFTDRSLYVFKCQNCGNDISISSDTDLRYLNRRSNESSFKVYILPDDIEIKYKFSF